MSEQPIPLRETDAEFMKALLSYFAIAGGVALDQKKWDEGYTAPEVIEEGLTYYGAEIERRFTRVLDLHGAAVDRARVEALRELRGWIVKHRVPGVGEQPCPDNTDEYRYHHFSRGLRQATDALLDQIDAMLNQKGGE